MRWETWIKEAVYVREAELVTLGITTASRQVRIRRSAWYAKRAKLPSTMQRDPPHHESAGGGGALRACAGEFGEGWGGPTKYEG